MLKNGGDLCKHFYIVSFERSILTIFKLRYKLQIYINRFDGSRVLWLLNYSMSLLSDQNLFVFFSPHLWGCADKQCSHLCKGQTKTEGPAENKERILKNVACIVWDLSFVDGELEWNYASCGNWGMYYGNVIMAMSASKV